MGIRSSNDALYAKILEAGKDEFFRRGFGGATMREIAALAGVTTGAIYCYFPNKKALFDALVREPAQHILDLSREAVKDMDTKMQADASQYNQWMPEEPAWMVDYLYEHYDAFRLIGCCAVGTEYEHFLEELIEIETESTMRFITYLQAAGLVTREIDIELVHITASTYYTGFFEPIVHDMPKDKAVKYICVLTEFYSAGWKKILGL